MSLPAILCLPSMKGFAGRYVPSLKRNLLTLCDHTMPHCAVRRGLHSLLTLLAKRRVWLILWAPLCRLCKHMYACMPWINGAPSTQLHASVPRRQRHVVPRQRLAIHPQPSERGEAQSFLHGPGPCHICHDLTTSHESWHERCIDSCSLLTNAATV